LPVLLAAFAAVSFLSFDIAMIWQNVYNFQIFFQLFLKPQCLCGLREVNFFCDVGCCQQNIGSAHAIRGIGSDLVGVVGVIRAFKGDVYRGVNYSSSRGTLNTFIFYKVLTR
jgi:hypothetical protein